ncbi:MAG: hypothetical protein ACI8P3_003363 [Saprospiraceae bacterium]|jgi:hypothetical protein
MHSETGDNYYFAIPRVIPKPFFTSQTVFKIRVAFAPRCGLFVF